MLRTLLTELSKFPNLVWYLDLSNNPLNDLDAITIAEFLPRLNLSGIVLNETHLTAHGVEAIVTAGYPFLQYCDVSKLSNCSKEDMDRLKRLALKYHLSDGLVIPEIGPSPAYPQNGVPGIPGISVVQPDPQQYGYSQQSLPQASSMPPIADPWQHPPQQGYQPPYPAYQQNPPPATRYFPQPPATA
jgi:hypothetical protein